MRKIITQSIRFYVLAAIVYSLAIGANAMFEHYCLTCALVVGLLCALCFVSPIITASSFVLFLFQLKPEPTIDWKHCICYSLLYVAITFAIHYFFTKYLPIWNFSIAIAIIYFISVLLLEIIYHFISQNISNLIVRNKDGSYTIRETKLRKTTKLTKGQRNAKAHVETGNKQFEVRSDNTDLNIRRNQVIEIREYDVIYKYK